MAETKFLDTNFVNQFLMPPGGTQMVEGFPLDNANNPLNVSLLNGILQGQTSSATTRIGNKIFVKGIWISIGITPSLAATTTDNGGTPTYRSLNTSCRIMIVAHKQAQKGMANLLEILDVNSVPVIANRNSAFYKNYDIVYDKLHHMVPTAVTGDHIASGPVFRTRFFLPIGKSISYDASTAAAGAYVYTVGGTPYTLVPSPGGLVYHQTNNLTNLDYQVIAFTDTDNGTCCRMTLGWKVLFTDQ